MSPTLHSQRPEWIFAMLRNLLSLGLFSFPSCFSSSFFPCIYLALPLRVFFFPLHSNTRCFPCSPGTRCSCFVIRLSNFFVGSLSSEMHRGDSSLLPSLPIPSCLPYSCVLVISVMASTLLSLSLSLSMFSLCSNFYTSRKLVLVSFFNVGIYTSHPPQRRLGFQCLAWLFRMIFQPFRSSLCLSLLLFFFYC